MADIVNNEYEKILKTYTNIFDFSRYDRLSYDIENKEELDLRDKNIPVSLLEENGNIVYIDGGLIRDLSDLDFNMLRKYGMC